MTMTLRPERTLGQTGVKVPLIGYGTAPLGKKEITREYASRCLNHAIDRGITYLDTSPDYDSEPHVGEVMRTRRKEVFLATKINKRKKESVLEEIRQSLEKLQTDHVDLIQVHAVSALADLEQALAPDGAVAACEQARNEGLVRYIGITGHARPEILAEALRRYPFDTVLCALGIADRLVTGPERFLLPEAEKRNVGVIAMKVFGSGAFKERKPALHYSLGLPAVSLAILGLKTTEEIDQAVEHAASFHPLERADLDKLIAHVRPIVESDAKEAETKGHSTLFWLHDTNVMGWSEKDEPSLSAY